MMNPFVMIPVMLSMHIIVKIKRMTNCDNLISGELLDSGILSCCFSLELRGKVSLALDSQVLGNSHSSCHRKKQCVHHSKFPPFVYLRILCSKSRDGNDGRI
jgi:hypothetical protein